MKLAGRLRQATPECRRVVSHWHPSGLLNRSRRSIFGIFLARSRDGREWTWGSNGYGQLGTGSGTHSNVPEPVNLSSEATAIAAGFGHSIVGARDSALWAWGHNIAGQLGTGSASFVIPTPVASRLELNLCGCRTCDDVMVVVQAAASGDLGIERSLDAKANALCAAHGRDSTSAANVLRAMKNEVRALEHSQRIEQAAANTMDPCLDDAATSKFSLHQHRPPCGDVPYHASA